jgi:hypothetical protein
MKRRIYLAVVTTAVVLSCAFSHKASAATVTYTQNGADFTTLPASSFNPTPVLSTNTLLNQTGELSGQYRSPFENAQPGSGGVLLSDGGYGLPGYASLQFTAIEAGGSATYNFAQGATGLSLLWGSPDSYNTLTFYSGLNGTGTNLFSITGSALDPQSLGHDLVDFMMSGGIFDSVVLTTSENAFEFADLQDAPASTPLPATLPLFAGGLAGLGLLMLRRNGKRQALA